MRPHPGAHAVALGAAVAALAMPAAGGGGARLESGVVNAAHPKERVFEVLTKPFLIDRVFPSMRGPFDVRSERLLEGEPELLWLTGFRVEQLDAETGGPAPPEYECHSNLNFPLLVESPPPGGVNRSTARAFTLTQGQVDVRLPPGFGLPVMSSEPLSFVSQALNLSPQPIRRDIRHRVQLRHLRDRDVGAEMKPLVPTAPMVMVSLGGEGHVWNQLEPAEGFEEATCQAGLMAEGIKRVRQDRNGRLYAPHWVVEPGRHEYRMRVTDQLGLPHDARVHFIGVHVHPYSDSLELRDLTLHETVWTSRQETRPDGVGLSRVDYYSSAEGLLLYQDHEYAMISVYDNTSGGNSDAMATLFIYYRDESFEKPGT